MNSDQRAQALAGLLNTSVSDCATELSFYTDPPLLCDLLLECRRLGHASREQAVRRRIAQLIKGEKK